MIEPRVIFRIAHNRMRAFWYPSRGSNLHFLGDPTALCKMAVSARNAVWYTFLGPLDRSQRSISNPKMSGGLGRYFLAALAGSGFVATCSAESQVPAERMPTTTGADGKTNSDSQKQKSANDQKQKSADDLASPNTSRKGPGSLLTDLWLMTLLSLTWAAVALYIPVTIALYYFGMPLSAVSMAVLWIALALSPSSRRSSIFSSSILKAVRDRFGPELFDPSVSTYPSDAVLFFGCHPHGALAIGSVVLAAELAAVGRSVTLIVSPFVMFCCPFVKHILGLLGVGVCSSRRSDLEKLFAERKSDVVAAVGGMDEVALAERDQTLVYINNRRGLISMALRNKYSIVPVFVDGENDLYDNGLRYFFSAETRLRMSKFLQHVPMNVPMGKFGILAPLYPKDAKLKIKLGPQITSTTSVPYAHKMYLRSLYRLSGSMVQVDAKDTSGQDRDSANFDSGRESKLHAM